MISHFKITDTSAYTDKQLTGHSGPILSVSLDPVLHFLASASCDGTVRIWNVKEKKQVSYLIKNWLG